ncbi:uncharacterized protein LOC133926975 isoform X2 [Phragmites australis]|uniref:uncharacterized protein LOC133926975 isoform X2 n=1 Tax=Phragmites australis TaxID=29695 RepID=UPI002D78C971|nr:uncharacterized protein LOC133926975 isoform X2 [Phragmites australis]
MRRSSSGARVSEGGDDHHHSPEALPTYDPQSAAGRREAARARALGRTVHCIPVVVLLCALLLWLSASTSSSGHTHLD